MKSSTKKLFILSSIALITLAGCGSKSKESPEVVMQKFKENVRTIESVDGSGTIVMKGEDASDNINLTGSADIKVDNREGQERKFDMSLKLDGNLIASGRQLEAKLNVMLKVLGDSLYFNISELESSDPSIESFKPVIEPYKGKWLKLASEFVPQNLKELQQQDPVALEKEEQLKDLFVNTKLFEVTEQHGIESVNGHQVHHYGLKMNKGELKKYIKQASEINGQSLTDADIEEAAAIADAISKLEFWIGVDDYHLYKGMISLKGNNAEEGVESTIELSFSANSYNKALSIDAPSDYEDFNPISLLMGMQIPGGAESLPSDLMIDGADGDAMMKGDAMMEKDGGAMMEKEVE